MHKFKLEDLEKVIAHCKANGLADVEVQAYGCVNHDYGPAPLALCFLVKDQTVKIYRGDLEHHGFHYRQPTIVSISEGELEAAKPRQELGKVLTLAPIQN